jgi:hypothetical protein
MLVCLRLLCNNINIDFDETNQESGTASGAKGGRNTKDRKNRHSVTPKLITTSPYFKGTIDNVHSAVDFLNKYVA